MLGRLIGLLAAASKEDRRRAAEDLIALARQDRAAVDALRAALADAESHRRWGAAFVLYRAGFRDDGVFAGASEALGSDDGDVRWAAAEILVSLAASDRERCHRIRSIAADPGAAGRKMALYCLRDLGVNDDAVFADALTARDTAVRLAAAACFGRVPVLSELGVDALLATVTQDGDAGVRRAAAVALRNASDHEGRVRPVLERLRAQSSDADLARAAERALAGLAAGHDGK